MSKRFLIVVGVLTVLALGSIGGAFACLSWLEDELDATPDSPVESPCMLSLVLVVDGARADEFPGTGGDPALTPELARMFGDGTAVTEAVTSSVSRRATLASIRTGLPPEEHGLRSARAIGRHRVPTGLPAPEAWYERDDAYVAFDDGYDPARVVGHARAVAERSATSARLFVRLRHLVEDVGAADDDVPALLEARLAPFRAGNEALDEALSNAALPGRDVVADVRRALGRRRGTPAWKALRRAVDDAKLVRLDRDVGDLVRRLEEHVLVSVALVGTGGRYLTEDRPDGPVEGFSESVLRTPILLGPSALPRGPRDWLMASEDVVRAIAFDVPEAGSRDHVRVDAPGLGKHAVVGRRFKVIAENGAGGARTVVRRADDAVVALDELADDERAEADMLLASAGTRYGLQLTAGAHVDESISIVVRSPSKALRAASIGRGEATVSGGGAVARMSVARPSTVADAASGTFLVDMASEFPTVALEVSVGGTTPEAAGVALALPGRRAGAALPVLADPQAADWVEGEPYWVDVVREPRGVWRIDVPAATDATELRILRYPPDDDALGLEVELEGNATVVSEPVLPNAAVVRGPGSFSVRVKLGSGRPAVCATIRGQPIPPSRYRFDGKRATTDRLTVVLPPWLPDRPDWFCDDAPSADGDAFGDAESRTILIARHGTAPVLEGRLDLTVEEARALLRLPRTE